MLATTYEKEKSSMVAEGLIRNRALLNYNRLHTEYYTPDNVFQKESYTWYGDWEGRAILALAHASLSTGENTEHLVEIVRRLPSHYNAKGYIGPVYEDGVKDEQQLAGHSWLLRGLLAYTKMTGDKNVENQIHTIIRNLVLPLKGNVKKYPAGSSQRAINGESMGTIVQEITNGWKVSTDVGCAFILLDGITDVFETYGGEELKELIEEMIEHFFNIDVAKESYQTHATLTTLRAVLRYMKTTNCYFWLDKVIERMRMYVDTAMTENYQNYNWFGLPKSTEPCAIADSFIVSLELWKATKDVEWLDLAENVFYNGFLSSQRDNGGFGCELCAGSELESVYFTPKHYEAYWCCSMRGAEGFLRYLEKSVCLEENTITFPVYNSFSAQVNHNSVSEVKHKTEYPYNGYGEIIIQTKNKFEGTVSLYIPKNVENFSVYKNGQAISFEVLNGFAVIPIHINESVTLTYSFDLITGKQKAMHYPGYVNRRGVLILARSQAGEIPLVDLMLTKQACEVKNNYQILFSNT